MSFSHFDLDNLSDKDNEELWNMWKANGDAFFDAFFAYVKANSKQSPSRQPLEKKPSILKKGDY
jgi:hypothetical protein